MYASGLCVRWRMTLGKHHAVPCVGAVRRQQGKQKQRCHSCFCFLVAVDRRVGIPPLIACRGVVTDLASSPPSWPAIIAHLFGARPPAHPRVVSARQQPVVALISDAPSPWRLASPFHSRSLAYLHNLTYATNRRSSSGTGCTTPWAASPGWARRWARFARIWASSSGLTAQFQR